jgi:hypothetical protein
VRHLVFKLSELFPHIGRQSMGLDVEVYIGSSLLVPLLYLVFLLWSLLLFLLHLLVLLLLVLLGFLLSGLLVSGS